MTTIVYRDGVMASDSQATSGNIRSSVVKMWQLDGCILGVAGDYNQGLQLLDWAKASLADEDPDPIDISELQAMFLSRKGLFVYEGEIVPMRIQEKYWAIGTGSELALGAMSMGADARQAVKVASQWDVHTGGRIITMSLIKPKSRV